MKVIIAGSRDVVSEAPLLRAIARFLAEHGPVTRVLCGGARGVDELGRRWAERLRIPVDFHDADWNRHGVAAGPIRNREMARAAEGLIAVWDGESSGTRGMISEARRAGIPVVVERVDPVGPPAFKRRRPGRRRARSDGEGGRR